MQKKHFILIGVAVLLLVGLLYFIFSRPEGEAYEEIDTIMGVPINAELIIHFPDLEEFIENTEQEDGTWTILKNSDFFQDVKTYQKALTNALNSSELSQLLDDAQLTIATKRTGRDGIEFNYIFPLQTSKKKDYIEKFLAYYFKEYRKTSQKYSDFTLFHITDNQSNTDYFYSFVKGLFIFSTSRISLEDALLQIKSNHSLLDKESFNKLKKIASPNDDLNIFINGTTFPKLLALNIDKKYYQFVKKLTDFTTQIGIDVSIKDNSVLLNGFLYSNTDDFFYTNMLLNQEAVPLTIEEVIPADTQFWASLSLSNEAMYLDNYKRYLEQTGDIKEYRKFSNNFEKQTEISPEKFMYPLIDSEIGLVISQAKVLGQKANHFCVVKTKSKSETEKKLRKICANYTKNKKQKLPINTFKIEENLEYTLYTFPSSNFANMMWGGLFFETPTNVCTLVDNYLIFSDKKEHLKAYIKQIARRKTLEFDEFYQNQKKFWVDNESTFTAYIRNGDGSFFKHYSNENIQKLITEKSKELQKFPSASIQLKPLNEMLYLSGYISYNNTPKSAPKTVWQSRLDTPLRMKPILVRNHKTQEQELIFQDTDNMLYLVSNSGVILWKIPLEAPILGTIHQIDVYKNNKLQYLFNTQNKLYLIDRNGHKVSGFPVDFRSPATNGIAVFDYDNNRNYRIFVACKDKHTYLYDRKGKLIKGWEATKNEHIVHTDIQHFVNKNKDYIVYNDGYRNYILNRRGNVRVLPKKNFEKAPNSELCVAKASRKQKGMLIATDMSGTIYFTHLNGEVQTKKVGDFSKNHYFTSYDLNCDGANDFVFVDKGKLFVFDHSGKEIFTHEFDTDKIGTPNFYTFSKNDKKLGICAENKIYLFNANGAIYDGFPLEGYSDFTIGFTTKNAQNFNLFVAGNSDLLFNYSVE